MNYQIRDQGHDNVFVAWLGLLYASGCNDRRIWSNGGMMSCKEKLKKLTETPLTFRPPRTSHFTCDISFFS